MTADQKIMNNKVGPPELSEEEKATHSGSYCYGKTPMATFEDSLPLAKTKKLDDCLQSTIEQNNIVCQMN